VTKALKEREKRKKEGKKATLTGAYTESGSTAIPHMRRCTVLRQSFGGFAMPMSRSHLRQLPLRQPRTDRTGITLSRHTPPSVWSQYSVLKDSILTNPIVARMPLEVTADQMILTVNHPKAHIDGYDDADLDLYADALTTVPLKAGSRVRLLDKMVFTDDMVGTTTYALRATTTGTVIADRSQTQEGRLAAKGHSGVTLDREASYPFEEDIEASYQDSDVTVRWEGYFSHTLGLPYSTFRRDNELVLVEHTDGFLVEAPGASMIYPEAGCPVTTASPLLLQVETERGWRFAQIMASSGEPCHGTSDPRVRRRAEDFVAHQVSLYAMRALTAERAAGTRPIKGRDSVFHSETSMVIDFPVMNRATGGHMNLVQIDEENRVLTLTFNLNLNPNPNPNPNPNWRRMRPPCSPWGTPAARCTVLPGLSLFGRCRCTR